MSLPSRERGLKSCSPCCKKGLLTSLPSRERGLKSYEPDAFGKTGLVAPLAGAWIEIGKSTLKEHELVESLPSRERGLKFERRRSCLSRKVAPLAGAWIEITQNMSAKVVQAVAPLAGAWIEIVMLQKEHLMLIPSLPSRERGLKLLSVQHMQQKQFVAPLAGAWIEILRNKEWASSILVAPLAGAWIEIMIDTRHIHDFIVAPLAGAWIEI